MDTGVTISELVGLPAIRSIFPLYRQSSPLSEADFDSRLSAMVAQGNYRCIAAYDHGQMVGVAGFWTSTQLWCGRYVEADNVVVDAAVRSRGIGAALMAWIEAEGERLGCLVIRATMVLGRDRTHAFYARNGFFDDGMLLVKALSAGKDSFPEYVARPD